MTYKKVFQNKNAFTSPSRMTWQELRIRQLLEAESIPFECQKVFRVNGRRFIVDFFIDEEVILECSATSMKKYQVAIRHKAIQLEAKCSLLSDVFSFRFWVLFHAPQPLSTLFLRNLSRLMPSVDQIFTSLPELLDVLSVKEIVSTLSPSWDSLKFVRESTDIELKRKKPSVRKLNHFFKKNTSESNPSRCKEKKPTNERGIKT